MTTIVAPNHWRTVEFISDIHLSADEPLTAAAWMAILASSKADAIFILGDWFEVWVGDDDDSDFVSTCARAVQACVARGPQIYVLHGNRDFLIGEAFAKRCGFILLPDPCKLVFGGTSYVLSHGDALCTDDLDYVAFRQLVRSSQWQSDFLAKPLTERKVIATALRAQSKAKQSNQVVYADVNATLAAAWLTNAGSRVLIHGHTHKPAEHQLDDELKRVVLSDWDVTASPRRAQVLRLGMNGLQRIDL